MNFLPGWLKSSLLGCALMTAAAATAAPILDPENPLGSFTNLASHLLASELNVSLTQIQVYPTNQYTPAVHRLLQVAANVYDASTTNFYPSVFRPLFSRDNGGWGTNVFISGFEQIGPFASGTFNVNNPPFDTPVDVSFLAATNGVVTDLPVNVYNVPWIIGAKKGFPNFNEFVMENVVSVTRRLQLTRNTNMQPPVITGTNQMYLIGLNSSLGVDLWNSYSNAYLGNVTGWVRDTLSVSLTNDDVFFNVHPGFQQPLGITLLSPIFTNSWTGAWPMVVGNPNANSFLVPLNNTFTLLTNSVYRSPFAGPGTLPPGFTAPCLVPTNYLGGIPSVYETNTPGFPFPHFGLLTTNQLQVFMLDQTNGIYYVIDYVHFEQVTNRDLNAEIFSDDTSGVWNTNLNPAPGVPYGILNQITIARGIPPNNGIPPGEDGLWKSDPQAGSLGGTVLDQQMAFEAFFLPYGSVISYTEDGITRGVSNLQSSVQIPYSPTRYGVGYTVLQANDPLVHYLASDMNPSYLAILLTNHYNYDLPPPSLTNLDLGSLNSNYQPWGGSSKFNLVPGDIASWTALTAYNLALKDPLVRRSDSWVFPNGQNSDLTWVGQVHRGTPWQTIYLKTSDILGEAITSGSIIINTGTNLWMDWTGDTDPADAAAMAPVRDWHLASRLMSLLNTNPLPSLFSVNNPDPGAWQALFDGMTVLTNTLSNIKAGSGAPVSAQFSPIVISSNSPQASFIADAIQTARAGLSGQYFRNIGDVLAIPQLTQQSPFLNWNNTAQQTNGISDVAYEAIPSQLLPLLRTDSIGSLAPANGQWLVQFTGYDEHVYAVQVSSDLLNWTGMITNSPVNGVFGFTVPAPADSGPQFYRSVLLQ